MELKQYKVFGSWIAVQIGDSYRGEYVRIQNGIRESREIYLPKGTHMKIVQTYSLLRVISNDYIDRDNIKDNI